jgi:hypothetical protein
MSRTERSSKRQSGEIDRRELSDKQSLLRVAEEMRRISIRLQSRLIFTTEAGITGNSVRRLRPRSIVAKSGNALVNEVNRLQKRERFLNDFNLAKTAGTSSSELYEKSIEVITG